MGIDPAAILVSFSVGVNRCVGFGACGDCAARHPQTLRNAV